MHPAPRSQRDARPRTRSLSIAVLPLLVAGTTGCFGPAAPGGAPGSAPARIRIQIPSASPFQTAFAQTPPPVLLPQGPISTATPAGSPAAPASSGILRDRVIDARGEGSPPLNLPTASTNTPAPGNTPEATRTVVAAPGNTTAAPVSLLGMTQTGTGVQTAAVPATDPQSIIRALGIRVTGQPTGEQIQSLATAAQVYPAAVVSGLTFHFPAEAPPDVETHHGIKGQLRGLHDPATSTITIWRISDSAQVMVHEIVHNIQDVKDPQWGNRLNQAVAAAVQAGQVPLTPYARATADRGDWKEVAAEVFSLAALRTWTPAHPQLVQVIQELYQRHGAAGLAGLPAQRRIVG